MLKRLINNLKDLKCRISDNDDGFKILNYLDEKYDGISDGQYLILVCDSNHINKYKIVEIKNKENQDNVNFEFQMDWHDPQLEKIKNIFDQIRRNIPAIDRERFDDFLSFCSLGDGHLYGAAISSRVILEDLLSDIYYKPMINYLNSGKAGTDLLEDHKEIYGHYKIRYGEDSKELRCVQQELTITKLINIIESNDNLPNQQNEKYYKTLSSYIKYKKESESVDLNFYATQSQVRDPLRDLWKLSSGIAHGRQNDIGQLITAMEHFIIALEERKDLLNTWKVSKEGA